MKIRKITGAIAGALLVSALFAAPASATPQDDFGPTREFFEDYGVPSDTAEALIAKLKAGESWESTKKDAVAVSEKTEVTADSVESVKTFSDGSITVTAIGGDAGTPKGTVSTQADKYHKCARTQQGSGYVNYYECTVSGKNGLLEMVFHADYTRTPSGAIINRAYSPYAYTTGGTAATPSLSVTRKNSSGSSPAEAHAQTQFKASNNGQSFTAHLYLRVTASAATVATAGF
jgi:hypothetical protein